MDFFAPNPLRAFDPSGFSQKNSNQDIRNDTEGASGEWPRVPVDELTSWGQREKGQFLFDAITQAGSVGVPAGQGDGDGVPTRIVFASRDELVVVPQRTHDTQNNGRNWFSQLADYGWYALGFGLIAFDIANSPVSPGPDAGMVGAAIIASTRASAKGIASQIAKIERQLARHGRASVEKSLRSLEKRLAEHRQARETYRAQGGFTSSVERETRAFEAEIQAIKEVLGRGP